MSSEENGWLKMYQIYLNVKKNKKVKKTVDNIWIVWYIIKRQPENGWFIKKEMFFENWAKRQFE